MVEPESWNEPSEGVAVTRAGVRIGRDELELPTDEKHLVLALGAPDRREAGENRILVWDRLGIFAYQRPDADVIDAIAVSFSCADADFCPKQGYAGVLVVGKAVFRHTPEPRDFVRYRFRADEFTCFKKLGRYQVSVGCIDAGPGLGTFEIALRD